MTKGLLRVVAAKAFGIRMDAAGGGGAAPLPGAAPGSPSSAAVPNFAVSCRAFVRDRPR